MLLPTKASMSHNEKLDSDRLEKAQRDFEKKFGVREDTEVYISEYLGETVIVVENEKRIAYYNFSIEILKVLNLGD